MPKIEHLKPSLLHLTLAEAMDVIMASRIRRDTYIAPKVKTKAKAASAPKERRSQSKPSTKARTRRPKKSALELFANLSPEQQLALLEKMKGN